MLEVLEIISGATLLFAYLILTVWLPIAFLGVMFFILAFILRAFLHAVASALAALLSPFNVALRRLPFAWRRTIENVVEKSLLLILWLIAFGSVGLFYRWTQGFKEAWHGYETSGWENVAMTAVGDAVRLVALYFERVQDEALRFWLGRTLPQFLSESTDIGPQALAHFSRLSSLRFYEALRPAGITEIEFRWLAASFVVAILLALLFMGIPRLRIGRPPIETVPTYWSKPEEAEEAKEPKEPEAPVPTAPTPTPSPAPPWAAPRDHLKTGMVALFRRIRQQMPAATPPLEKPATPLAPEAQTAPQPPAPETVPAAASVSEQAPAVGEEPPVPTPEPPLPQPIAAVPARGEEPSEKPILLAETVELVVSPMPSFTKLLSLERFLTQSALVKSCFIRSFSRGTAVIEVKLSAPTKLSELAEVLRKVPEHPLTIEKAEDGKIEARVQPPP